DRGAPPGAVGQPGDPDREAGGLAGLARATPTGAGVRLGHRLVRRWRRAAAGRGVAARRPGLRRAPVRRLGRGGLPRRTPGYAGGAGTDRAGAVPRWRHVAAPAAAVPSGPGRAPG